MSIIKGRSVTGEAPKFGTHVEYGPWDTEPARLDFWHAGLRCLVLRHQTMGHLCGYVRIPSGKMYRRLKAHGRLLEEKPTMFLGRMRRKSMYDHRMFKDLYIHGGLTYSGRLCGVPKTKDGLWLGFDCAHYEDLIPAMNKFGGSVYRTITYVERETRDLADRVREVMCSL